LIAIATASSTSESAPQSGMILYGKVSGARRWFKLGQATEEDGRSVFLTVK